jgi:sterol desaturase/sphingolipid hydroxylase (fatty acid hydroxylase superfamily)
MDVTTSGRYHVGEIVISSILLAVVIVLLGIRLWELLLYEVLAAVVGQFHHANVALPAALDRALRLVIVTPGMHRVHHSRRVDEMNSNFSSVLSVWDRIGRTYRVSASPRDIAFGLEGDDRLTFSGLMRRPLRPPGVEP